MITFKNKSVSFDTSDPVNSNDVVVIATAVSALTLVLFLLGLSGTVALIVMLLALVVSVIALAVNDVREFPVKRPVVNDFPAANQNSNDFPVTNQFSGQHSSDFLVGVDYTVNDGAAVGDGKPDNTGNSTGPHVHFENKE